MTPTEQAGTSVDDANGPTTYLIGGESGCDHETAVRVGQDAGMNVYMECRTCGGAVVLESEHPPSTRVDDRPAPERDAAGRNPRPGGDGGLPLDPYGWIERLREWVYRSR